MSRLSLTLRLVWSAGLDVWFACLFLITWIRPYTFGERTVHHLTFVMLLEFIVVHASGFLGAVANRDEPGWRRGLMFLGLFLFYNIFAGSFALMYGGWWPMLFFWCLMLSRFPAIVLRPPDAHGQMWLMANWAAMTALYIFGVMITVIPPVPVLGVTPEVIETQNFGMEGVWPEEPYRVLAFGTFYFTGLAIVAVINEVIAYRSPKDGNETPDWRQQLRDRFQETP